MQLNEKDLKRKEDIEQYIINRTSITKEVSNKELNEASEIIKQLNAFIDGHLELSHNGIDRRVERLVKHFTINLIYELNSEIAFRRARKFEEENSKVPFCFDNLQDLSYIPDSLKDKIPIGRLNKKEESIFYATIHYKEKEEQFFDTDISEINGNKFEYINILDSIPTKRLNVIYIGVFDYFVRNKRLPALIDNDLKEEFSKVFLDFENKCRDKGLSYLYQSYIICSAFFEDVMRREGSDKLYMVTSAIGSRLLKDNNVDGIVYESVKVTDEPSIAIKPCAVKHHLEHKEALCCKIENNFGYGLYNVTLINKCEIVHDKLDWKEKYNAKKTNKL